MLHNILTASIHGSIVIAVVMVLRLVLRKVPKKYICLLWLLAGIRLLLPIPVKSPFSLQPNFQFIWPDSIFLHQLLPLVTILWGVVALGFGLYSILSYHRLRQQVQDAVKIRGGWESSRIDTAFILGFLKPKIYIPAGMSSQERRYILEHERTHLDKGDHWIKMIGFLALALHWFNPLVWVAYILLCKDIEMACDERVVQFMELDERKGYSNALLSCSAPRFHFASPVAFGEISVKERILSVLRYKKPGVIFSLLGILALCFVTVCLVTNPDTPMDVPLTPEQQSQQEKLTQCYQDVQQLLSQDTFYLELLGGNYTTEDRSGVTPVWFVTLCRQDGNTLWEYISSSPEPTQGCLSLDGETYALYQGKWVQTDQADSQWQAYLDAILWDPETVQFVQEETNERGRSVHFTAQWQDAQKTTYTNTIRCTYNSRGKFAELKMDTSRFPDAQVLMLSPHVDMPGEEPADIGQMMRTRKESVRPGQVTGQELAAEAEALSWGVSFRVDDDRLSPSGSDVYVGQTATGKGSLSTGMQYWLEKKVNGQWEKLPTITDAPAVTSDGISLAKDGPSTYGYLDWTPLYGQLEPGEYRMGKFFRNYYNNSSSTLTFYSEFAIVQTVDSNSPEAAAAVQRCYDAVDELKARDHIHFKENVFGEDEAWIHGSNYLQIRDFGQDNPDMPENNGRIDISARWDNIGYQQVWNGPDVRESGVRGMALSSLDASNWRGSFAESSFNLSFFERNNKTASFPEGVGVISDEMVRFVLTWPVAGLEMPEASAQLTYKFNAQGQLIRMEYLPLYDTSGSISFLEILDTSAEEIDAKIRSYTKDLIVDSFSWQEAQAKYTDADFNIRQDGFANNGGSPITGPVDAAKLALKEYPNLVDYLGLTVYRDESAGMWKVTIRAYIDYQSTYSFRDVYLTDNGQTKLLVYEGPLSFDEPRK